MQVYGINISSWDSSGLPGLVEAYVTPEATEDTTVDWYLYDCAGIRYIYWFSSTVSAGTYYTPMESGDVDILDRISSGDYQLATYLDGAYFKNDTIFYVTSSGGGGDSGGGDSDETYDIGDELELGYAVNNGQVVAMVRYMNTPYPSSFPDRYIAWQVGGTTIGSTDVANDDSDSAEFAYNGTS